jgi:IS30 family transposase
MSHLQKLNDELKKLKKDVTGKDKKECERKLDVHHNTIYNYLNGDGKDADLATKMIAFYRKQIDKRNSIIA